MEVIRSPDAQLYCCFGAMIDDLAEAQDLLTVIVPFDVSMMMVRSDFDSKSTSVPVLIEGLVQHVTRLLSGNRSRNFDCYRLGPSITKNGRASICLHPA